MDYIPYKIVYGNINPKAFGVWIEYSGVPTEKVFVGKYGEIKQAYSKAEKLSKYYNIKLEKR